MGEIREGELNRYLELESLKEAKEKRINEYHRYKKNVKKTLLTEALLRIYNKCLYNPTVYESTLCESFDFEDFYQFVTEN